MTLSFSRAKPFVQFGRGYQGEQFCDFFFNLDKWFRRKGNFFKKNLIWSSGSPSVLWNNTICAIMKEGIMGNIHVKLSEIWTSCLGGDVFYRKSLQTAGRTHDEQRTKTDHKRAHLEPLAQVN